MRRHAEGFAGRLPTGDVPRQLTAAVRAAGPPLLFGVRLWASVCLALYVAFWLDLDNAYWAGTTAALVCQPHLGASLRKGWFRMIGTVAGSAAIVTLTGFFPQDRVGFLAALALWGAACAFAATILRNFAAYSAALAGYTAAIIASDQLGATGTVNGQAFTLAVTRASEICIGIICAGIVLAGTDFGSAARRLARQIAGLCAEILGGFTASLSSSYPLLSAAQPVRRELIRSVAALDPTVDEALGESARLRYHGPTLQAAVDGLLAALAGWRGVVVHLRGLPRETARQGADRLLQNLPLELREPPAQGDLSRWIADPAHPGELCEGTVRSLLALPAGTPSLRLLVGQAAEVLAGISRALDGVALLVDPDRAVPLGRRARLRVPDWLPALVNAGRAFAVIGAIELLWILTAWPNGAGALTWGAIGVILFAPKADQAYANALSFAVGAALAAPLAAVVKFAALPAFATFTGFAAVIGLYLVPVGALMVQPRQTAVFAAMAANFVPLLAPLNEMTYDTVEFYLSAVAIVAGTGAAALSFRLLPPLSPALLARRLLKLTRRDVRRLAAGPTRQTADDWRSRTYGRLTALPDQAEPLQRGQLLAALSVGSEIIELRRILRPLGLGAALDSALGAVARGDSTAARGDLARLDRMLASRPGALPIRAGIRAMSEALAEHAAYFDARPPG